MGTETKYTVLLFIKVLCNLYFGNTITKSKEDRVLPLIGVTVFDLGCTVFYWEP